MDEGRNVKRRGMEIGVALREQGYVFLSAFRAAESGASVAELLGVPVALGSGPAVHALRPHREEDSTPNTYSGLFGHGSFPFHSDLAHWSRPPRYLFLRAVIGYACVPTLLIDGNAIVSGVGASTLRRALVRPRRPVKGGRPLLRLYDEVGSEALLRWDQTFIKPASGAGREGFARVMAALEYVEPVSIPLVERGDTLIINNWRMLHARAAVPEGCEDRLLERAYLEGVR